MATNLPGNEFANEFSATPPVGPNNFRIVEAEDLVVTAFGGNDTISLQGLGFASNVTLSGGQGNDVIFVEDAIDSFIYGGVGNDTIVTGELVSSLVQSSAGDNRFDLSALLASSVVGGTGNDTISADFTSSSTIAAGAGDDLVEIDGSVSNSTVFLGEGDDTLTVGFAEPNGVALTVTGSAIQSSSGNNLIDIFGEMSRSSIVTGADDDTIFVEDLSDSTIAAGGGNDDIEVGNLVNSVIYAGGGDDTVSITGTFKNSLIQSGSGDNLFIVGSSLDGEGGAVVANASVIGGSGSDTVLFGSMNDLARNTVFTSIDAFLAEAGSTITLGENAEKTGIAAISVDDGTAGTTINAAGYTSAIAITGGAGADSLTGGSGNDTIIGGDGNDTITGGTGADLLTGGAGQNTFLFQVGDSFAATASLDATATFGDGVDVITDFVFTGGAEKGEDTLKLGGITVLNSDVGIATIVNGKFVSEVDKGFYLVFGNWDGSVFTADENGASALGFQKADGITNTGVDATTVEAIIFQNAASTFPV